MWCSLSVNEASLSPTKIVWSFPPGFEINHIETLFEAESLAALWEA